MPCCTVKTVREGVFEVMRQEKPAIAEQPPVELMKSCSLF
jgi:hypothetical protein